MQLNPTKLGTKSHWDQVYEEEKQNFEEIGDEGEVWFGQDAVDKMVEWTLKYCPISASEEAPFILDIGTGNGILPICLVEAGYSASTICGIDYSQAAIELANSVAKGRDVEGVIFSAEDLINGEVKNLEGIRRDMAAKSGSKGTDTGQWDLLLDKGTFDAIALSAPSDGPSPIDVYPQRVEELTRPGGYFLITSCNFTEDEIKSHFTTKAPSLKYHTDPSHMAESRAPLVARSHFRKTLEQIRDEVVNSAATDPHKSIDEIISYEEDNQR